MEVGSIISDEFQEVRKSERYLSLVTQHQADLCVSVFDPEQTVSCSHMQIAEFRL